MTEESLPRTRSNLEKSRTSSTVYLCVNLLIFQFLPFVDCPNASLKGMYFFMYFCMLYFCSLHFVIY